MTGDKGTERPIVAMLYIEYLASAGTGSWSPEELGKLEGELVKESYPIYEGSTLRLGRAKTNDIVLGDRDVSRFHATFSASGSGVVLSDLASTNGTHVRGRRISTPVDLLSGDVITLGNVKITVQLHYTSDENLNLEHSGTHTKLSELQMVEVTVLLADVCSYTKISQNLPPDDVAQMLRLWFEELAPIIKNHGGEIDKYIGDCVMALWRGKHEDAETLATGAAQAAVEIVHKTNQLGTSSWSHNKSQPWRCRVALNSGSALFGTVGTGDRRSYTVLGDAINVAFKIENIAGKLGSDIILSQTTAELVKQQFKLKNLGAYDLEGRIGEVKVFSLPV